MQSAQAQAAEADAYDPVRRQRLRQPERRCRVVLAADRREHADPLRRKAPGYVLDGLGSRPVEPLRVVDGQHDRCGGG